MFNEPWYLAEPVQLRTHADVVLEFPEGRQVHPQPAVTPDMVTITTSQAGYEYSGVVALHKLYQVRSTGVRSSKGAKRVNTRTGS